MSARSPSLGESILEKAADAIDAYEAYLAHLHYCDYPDEIPDSLGEANHYTGLDSLSPAEFTERLRDRLSFVLKRTLTATNRPVSMMEAEADRGIIPGVQLYLTQIVGNIAMQRVVEEGWEQVNPHIIQLTNPFENYETLTALWKYATDRRHTTGLNSLDVLAPGYYDKLPD